mgnify:CR=1 FL=1
MANNQLIQGAALTGKKFLDVGAAVAEGFAMSQPSGVYKNPRVKKNEQIQARVNTYMSRMKTDQDFTGFSPGETASMRNFLVGRRDEYAKAAKLAASFEDTTDPKYMEAVDIMQSVNNSFTNLAKQLESYKKGKLEYAQGQQDGIYSNGTNPELSEQTASMFGFWDHDDDKTTKKVKGRDVGFSINQGGDLGFDFNGNTIDYNNIEPLIVKDFVLAKGILNDNEAAYKSGRLQNTNSLNSYKLSLEQKMQNPNVVKSMIFDFNDELTTTDIQDMITGGKIDINQARDMLIDRLVESRKAVSQQGYNEKIERDRIKKPLTRSQVVARDRANSKLELLESGTIVNGVGNASGRFMKKIGTSYFEVDRYSQPLNADSLSQEQIVEVLNLYVSGLRWPKVK